MTRPSIDTFLTYNPEFNLTFDSTTGLYTQALKSSSD